MRILVTGGVGFIGSHVVDLLIENGQEVFVVYHLAAQIDVMKSVEEPVEDAKINILNSLNLLELCVKFGVKKFIFSSSGGAIYGDIENLDNYVTSYPEFSNGQFGKTSNAIAQIV